MKRNDDKPDLSLLTSHFDTALTSLAQLRDGKWRLDGSKDAITLGQIYDGLNSLSHYLEPRLAGLASALIRAHFDAGGTYGELAKALDTSRSSAQSRAIRVRSAGPGVWEKWATREGDPVDYPAADVRPGWAIEVTGGKRKQVQTVRVYGDGLVEADVDTSGSYCFAAGETTPAWPHNLPGVLESSGRIPATASTPEQAVTTYSRAPRRGNQPASTR